jgi:hypothetical protein
MSHQILGLEPEAGVGIRTSDGSRRSARAIVLCGYCLAALAAIFFVPYLVPVHASFSSSYAFGYSNRVGLLLTLGFTGIGALWMIGTPALRIRATENQSVSRKALGVALLGTAVLCSIGYPFLHSAAPVGDATYLVNRIQMASAGHRPYADFEFAYGPLFLYVPLWAAHLFHISIATAYYWFWVLTELAGVFLLFQVVDDTDIPSRMKSAIFLLLCSASGACVVTGAATYTFTRFALAPWLAFRIYRAAARQSNDKERFRTSFVWVTLSFVALLLFSPEIAVAFGLGSAAFWLLRANVRSATWWVSYAGMLSAMGTAIYAADRAHVLDTLRTFSAGARDSRSILPAIFSCFSRVFSSRFCTCCATS